VTEDQHVAKNKGQFKQIKQFQPNIRINSKLMLSKISIVLFTAALSTQACNQNKVISPSANFTAVPLPPAASSDFNGYWNAGKAEVSTYIVEQDRYGQMRKADQVNIFVTEDLSAQKQVKLDNAEASGADRVPVLKLNSVRRFETGIYDYSMMSSVFTPLKQGEASLKLTASIQDWCGQAFTQINRLDKAWRWRQFSYFEQEADTDITLDDCVLEDELFTQLRLNPEAWLNREIKLLPGLFYLRMKHLPTEAKKAMVTSKIEANQRITMVQYTDLPRQIRIVQEPTFPHRILEWEETENGKRFCNAKLNRIILNDYWSKNKNEFSAYRDSLGL
jgi:hypothetical protein